MNNIIKRVWNQNKMVNTEDLTGMAFQAESGGHTFQISGIDDTGAAVALSGTVAGVFRRPDNADIALTGSASEGVVSVTLTEDCYAVPGRFGLVVFLTSSGQKTALYACVGTVANTSGGAVAGDTPADVVDLVNAINSAIAAIPADYENLTKVSKDLQMNTLNSAVFGFGENNHPYELGAINSSTGADVTSTTRIRTCAKFLATKGSTVSLSVDEADLYVFLYDLDGSYLGSSGAWVKTHTFTDNCLTRLELRKNTSNATIDPSEVDTLAERVSISFTEIVPLQLSRVFTPDATNGLDADSFLSPGAVNLHSQELADAAQNIPERSPGLLINLETTRSLRIYQFYLTNNPGHHLWRRFYTGVDSRWRGWERVIMSSDVGKPLKAYNFVWSYGKSITSNGSLINSASFACSDIIPVTKYDVLTNTTGDKGVSSKDTVLYVAAYSGSTFVSRTRVYNKETYSVPPDIDGIRFVYGYPSTVTNPPDMTRGVLWNYFSVGYTGDTSRYAVYAAFGASTTKGAVHHMNGGAITYSAQNFPDYVGEKLNMQTYNLAVGSTGFLERANGDDNIMDQIYNNDAILSKAKLVTIMFGYGNDNWVGSPAKYFSIGHYTDYYPYDEEGYHPSGQAGLTTMITKGATLMGCLNWCIKWISEKYPFAQLVLIFGSPSANDSRAITMTAQTEGEGVAPYTLTFVEDPFKDNNDHYSAEYGIYLINEELKKLKKAMDIPVVNLFYEGNAFSFYSTYAKDPNESSQYALFSTKGTSGAETWNSHPNEEGYLYFARFVAGKIISCYVE